MANLVINGDFERDLELWDVQADRQWFTTIERPASSPYVNLSRGESLRISMGCSPITVSQTLFSGSFASDRLRFSYGGYGADFYVNIHYADGTVHEGAHIYGHWPEVWEDASVPVSRRKAIQRVEFLIMCAMDFYLDDISLEGTVEAMPEPLSTMKKAPEEVNDLPKLAARIEEHFMATERQLNRISAMLSMQRYPNLPKDIDDAFAKRASKEVSRGQGKGKR
jgi:hypothetical protein